MLISTINYASFLTTVNTFLWPSLLYSTPSIIFFTRKTPSPPIDLSSAESVTSGSDFDSGLYSTPSSIKVSFAVSTSSFTFRISFKFDDPEYRTTLLNNSSIATPICITALVDGLYGSRELSTNSVRVLTFSNFESTTISLTQFCIEPSEGFVIHTIIIHLYTVNSSFIFKKTTQNGHKYKQFYICAV